MTRKMIIEKCKKISFTLLLLIMPQIYNARNETKSEFINFDSNIEVIESMHDKKLLKRQIILSIKITLTENTSTTTENSLILESNIVKTKVQSNFEKRKRQLQLSVHTRYNSVFFFICNAVIRRYLSYIINKMVLLVLSYLWKKRNHQIDKERLFIMQVITSLVLNMLIK